MRNTIYYKWFIDDLKATYKMKDFREMSINQRKDWYIQWLESNYEVNQQLIDALKAARGCMVEAYNYESSLVDRGAISLVETALRDAGVEEL